MAATDKPPARPAMKKRLIVCCDGTWQSSNQGTRSVPSNIAKISRAVAVNSVEADGSWCPQVVYYDAGVGTAMGWLDQKVSGAFGDGLSENVCEGYNFLVNNYSPGDELYFFGFSRGAYTARSLASLVANVGICSNAMMDQFWEMYEAYTSREKHDIKQTEWGKGGTPTNWKGKKPGQTWQGKGKGNLWLDSCDKSFTIEVVGVFDTVGSLGWPDSAWANLTHWNDTKQYGFHDTGVHPKIKNAFHALALDERRRPFAPTLWHVQPGSDTRLIQCWFPGVHINSGGGQSDGLKDEIDQQGDAESMANITFAWMVDRVREATKLKFDDKSVDDIMTRYLDGLEKLIKREAPDSTTRVYRGWGVGPIKDSYSDQSLPARIVSGIKNRTPGQYHTDQAKEVHDEGKDVPAPAEPKAHNTQEYIHPVVAHASDEVIKRSVTYNWPKKNGFTREHVAGQGWVWKKVIPPDQPHWYNISYQLGLSKWTPNGEAQTILIPEWIIPSEDHFPFASLERKLILAKPIGPQAFDPKKAQKMMAEKKWTEAQAKEEYAKHSNAWFEDLKQDHAEALKFLENLDGENGYPGAKQGSGCICWACVDVDERFAQKAKM